MIRLFFTLASVLALTGCANFVAAVVNASNSSKQRQTVTSNAYGLGVNADQYGRPTTYQLQNGQQLDPIFNNGVKQNTYGPGVGEDQFGRPVYNSPP
jgi:hypothetical protein